MSAYSLDLREKIVESVKKGVPKAETARRFGGRSRHGQTLLQATLRTSFMGTWVNKGKKRKDRGSKLGGHPPPPSWRSLVGF